MADCIHTPDECSNGEHFTEYERTFEVNPKWLPEDLGKPYVFIQAYPKRGRGSKGREVSYRYIPATNQGWKRIKDLTMVGARDKSRIDIGGDTAREELYGKEIAVKFRYILEIHKRIWFVEYRPLMKRWIGETEYETEEAMKEHAETPYLWPPFIIKDITTDESGYTRNETKVLSNAQIDKWIETAKEVATDKKYDPAIPNDSDMKWLSGIEEEEEEGDGDDLPSGLNAEIVNYSESEGGFGCARCVFFNGNNKPCQVLDIKVKATGCCNVWEDDEGATYTGPKLTPEIVVYTEEDPSGKYVCGGCKFFKNGNCAVIGTKVDAKIGTCTMWQKIDN